MFMMDVTYVFMNSNYEIYKAFATSGDSCQPSSIGWWK